MTRLAASPAFTGGGFAGTMQALVPIGAEDGFTRYMESFFGKASVIRAI